MGAALRNTVTHTKSTSGAAAWSGPSTREWDTAIGKNRQAADLLEVSSVQPHGHLLLCSQSQGARVALGAGGCTASATPGCSALSSVVPEPIYFSNAIIHIELNQ